jgi:hypothetical protein
MEKIINGIPWGMIEGSLYIFTYFNYVHKLTDNDAKVVLFAGDTSIKVTTCNQEGFQAIQRNNSLIKSRGLKPISYRSTLIKHIIKIKN